MKIIILDFSTSEIFIFPYDENIYDNADDFFDSEYCKEKRIKETNCQYMVVDELILKIF